MSGKPRASVAILAAQVDEIAPLLTRLGARFDGKDARARYWRSDLDSIAIAVSGMGRRRARAAARALLDRSDARRLIVVGVAGALTVDLEIGALVVAETLFADDGPPLQTDPRGAQVAITRGALAAAVITVDRMIATVSERSALVGSVREACGTLPLVVDMESWDAATEAQARGAEATVLRVVSDGADETLPAFLERCRRPDGDLDRRRAVLAVLSHPRSLPQLLELRRRQRQGAVRLAELLIAVVPLLASDDRESSPRHPRTSARE